MDSQYLPQFKDYLRIIAPDLNFKGMMIAGGCIRDFMNNVHEHRDIDVFFKNKGFLDEAISNMKLPIKSDTPFVKTYAYNPPIQIIKHYTTDVDGLYKRITFTIGKVIYDYDTDMVHYDPRAFSDEKEGNLVVCNWETEFPLAAMQMAIKYGRKGLELDAMSIIKLSTMIANKYRK